MPVQTETSGTRRSYFLALENGQQGEVRPLADLIDRLAYNEQGLVPAVAQDARTGEVLMLAWMTQQAVEQTLATSRMTYFSRSRNELWIKGQTSGHFQQLVDMRIDCDGDALLCRVIPQGSACHTGRTSCFYLQTVPGAQQCIYADQQTPETPIRSNFMSAKTSPILAVPTNIITGFLGAGKTSAILNLLKYKPPGERWAILINEFGEIGVDGSLVQGNLGADTDIHIREVPGGCMCCAAGLPMQIALNQLLRRAKPQRLLIEPTGLGHPLEVLQTLSANHNSEVLSIEKTLTLVDARNLADERYAGHATFRQQLSIADVVVANKVDLYGPDDGPALESFIKAHCHPQTELVYTQYGALPLSHLAGPTAIPMNPGVPGHTGKSAQLLAQDLPFPECGFVTAMNSGEGFESIGWRFSPQKVFDRSRLFSFLSGLDVERMKAVFITTTGVFGYNLTRDALTETELDDCGESRIEIITGRIDPGWVDDLTDCLVTDS